MLKCCCAFICHGTSNPINGKCIIQEAMTHRLLMDRLSFLSYLDNPVALTMKEAWMLKNT